MTDVIRAYVPTTLAGLQAVADAGQVTAPVSAHAVTTAVRREWTDSSEEEWEYEALALAAEDCPELWTDGQPRRRVVIAVDVEEDDIGRSTDDPSDPTLCHLRHDVPLSRVAAVHADQSEADAEQGQDLAWFATQEIDTLLA